MLQFSVRKLCTSFCCCIGHLTTQSMARFRDGSLVVYGRDACIPPECCWNSREMYKIKFTACINYFCAVIIAIIIGSGLGWPCLRFVLFRSEIKFRREIDRVEKARARTLEPSSLRPHRKKCDKMRTGVYCDISWLARNNSENHKLNKMPS